jgi:hypothetical protein
LETNFAQIGGFLYFGSHFGLKMAAIANRNDRNMVQHVLPPVNIHYPWNLFIFEFLDLGEIGFQVDYDVANWYPNFTGMLSTMSRCADYFRNFQNGRRSHGNHKKHDKFKVLGMGWSFPEILSDMCNSQHHNLRRSKISPKSEDFCILAVILDSKWPP